MMAVWAFFVVFVCAWLGVAHQICEYNCVSSANCARLALIRSESPLFDPCSAVRADCKLVSHNCSSATAQMGDTIDALAAWSSLSVEGTRSKKALMRCAGHFQCSCSLSDECPQLSAAPQASDNAATRLDKSHPFPASVFSLSADSATLVPSDGALAAATDCTTMSEDNAIPPVSGKDLAFAVLGFVAWVALLLGLLQVAYHAKSLTPPINPFPWLPGCIKGLQLLTGYLDETKAAETGELVPMYGDSMKNYIISRHDFYGVCCCRCVGPPLPKSVTPVLRLLRMIVKVTVSLAATILLCGVDPNTTYSETDCPNETISVTTSGPPHLTRSFSSVFLVLVLSNIGPWPIFNLERAVYHTYVELHANKSHIHSWFLAAMPLFALVYLGIAVGVRALISGQTAITTYIFVFAMSQGLDWFAVSFVIAAISGYAARYWLKSCISITVLPPPTDNDEAAASSTDLSSDLGTQPLLAQSQFQPQHQHQQQQLYHLQHIQQPPQLLPYGGPSSLASTINASPAGAYVPPLAPQQHYPPQHQQQLQPHQPHQHQHQHQQPYSQQQLQSKSQYLPAQPQGVSLTMAGHGPSVTGSSAAPAAGHSQFAQGYSASSAYGNL